MLGAYHTIHDFFVLCFIHLSLLFLASEKHPMVWLCHHHSGMVLARWCSVLGYLQTWCLTFRPNTWVFVSLPQGASHGLRVLHVPFTEKWFPPCHSTIKAWLEECKLLSFWKVLLSPQEKQKLRDTYSYYRVLGHLLPQSLRLVGLVVVL